MGFCQPEETERFLDLVPGVEKAMADDGILLLKYWLDRLAAQPLHAVGVRGCSPQSRSTGTSSLRNMSGAFGPLVSLCRCREAGRSAA